MCVCVCVCVCVCACVPVCVCVCKYRVVEQCVSVHVLQLHHMLPVQKVLITIDAAHVILL